jgi:hypothetical protein
MQSLMKALSESIYFYNKISLYGVDLNVFETAIVTYVVISLSLGAVKI